MSKNILVVGGGTPGKFGNQFVNKAREDGHRVVNFSHKDHNTGHVDDRHINYNDVKQIKTKCAELASEMPVIDIILFNQNGAGYPGITEQLFKEPNLLEYNQTITRAVAVPHQIIVSLYNSLNTGSKVVYMGSTMSFLYDRENYIEHVGYPSAKSFAMHLISAMAKCRTKEITFSCMCPYFLYHKPDVYKNIFEQTYNYILNHDDSYNGKIVNQHDGFEKPYVPGKVTYAKQ